MAGNRLGGRSNNFDALRLGAALTVVVHHTGRFLHAPMLVHAYPDRLWFYDGVPVFFVVSGFLVFRSAEACLDQHRPWRAFYLNRFLRIAPGIYSFALLTTALVLGLGVIGYSSLASVDYLAWLATNLALVPVLTPHLFGRFGIGRLNPSLWTIPVEITFYAIVPGLVMLARRIGMGRMLGAVGVASIAGMVTHFAVGMGSVGGFALANTFVPYLWYFGLGILWSAFFWRVPAPGLIALLSVPLYLVVRYGPAWTNGVVPDDGNIWALVWAVPLSFMVVWFALCGPAFLNGIAAKIGDLSFGAYIWHAVVINLLIWLALKRGVALPTASALNLLVIAATLLVAFASWHLLEKRALRLKPFSSAEQANVRYQGLVSWSSPAPAEVDGAAGAGPPLPATVPEKTR